MPASPRGRGGFFIGANVSATVVEASADELIRSLLEPSPSMVFHLDRREPNGTTKRHALRVRMLRITEDITCLANAQAYAKERGEVSKDYGDIYREAQAVEVLTLALCHLEDRTRNDGTKYFPPRFTDPQQLRDSFTAPELAQCMNMYEIVKAKYGALEDFHPAETERWIARLADPLRGAYFLSALDSQAWPLLLLHMAQWGRSLCLEIGRPLPSSEDISESDPPSSDEDTGFSSLPHAESQEGDELPTDKLMTAEQARERAKQMRKKK